MKPNTTALERAFELAKSGSFSKVADIRAALSKEGYNTNQIEGLVLTRQLKALMRAHQSQS